MDCGVCGDGQGLCEISPVAFEISNENSNIRTFPQRYKGVIVLIMRDGKEPATFIPPVLIRGSGI